MDAANMLKPMLARGELRCIGATTIVRPSSAPQLWMCVLWMCVERSLQQCFFPSCDFHCPCLPGLWLGTLLLWRVASDACRLPQETSPMHAWWCCNVST